MSRQTETRRSRSRAARRRGVGMAFSLAAHGLILFLLFLTPRSPPMQPEPAPVLVSLVPGIAPAPIPAPNPGAAPAPQEQPKPKPKTSHAKAKPKPKQPVRLAKAEPVVRHAVPKPTAAEERAARIAAEDAPIATHDPTMTSAELAEAVDADGGGGGGDAGGGVSCDMAGRLQAVLRSDRRVHEAVAPLSGKAIRVWNGEWVWMRGDIGQGLTAVRQALTWEIAYAPEACRNKPMHGVVVFRLNEARGPVRLAVGAGDWRWTDLIGVRRGRG